jgi:hypothetical protein
MPPKLTKAVDGDERVFTEVFWCRIMRIVTRRIDKLEVRLGIAALKRPCTAIVVTGPGCEFAFSHDACVEILRESGFLPDGVLFGIVDLQRIPRWLTAKELERFLRQNGAEICGSDLGRNDKQNS